MPQDCVRDVGKGEGEGEGGDERNVSHCRYWLGVVQLAVAGGNRREALLTILALQDATLLQDSEKWGITSRTYQLMAIIISHT